MNNFDLSDLLSALEQDGKDARRQQQISQTIKHLEAQHRRRVLYFSIAAACLLLLIIPLGFNFFLNRQPSSQPLIAQTSDSVIPQPVIENPSSPSPSLLAHNKQVKPQPHLKIATTQPDHQPSPQSASQPIEDSSFSFSSAEADDSQLAESVSPTSEESSPTEPQPTPPLDEISLTQQPDPQPSQPSNQEKKRRRIFRLSRPSNMDGTVLAFNLNK